MIRERLRRFLGADRCSDRPPTVKLNLESLEFRDLPNNLLALLPLDGLASDSMSANASLVSSTTDPAFDGTLDASGDSSGLTPAQVVSAQPMEIAQPNPTVIAPTADPAPSPSPADLAFQDGFPDQAAGMLSDATFSNLLDATSPLPISPAAAPQPDAAASSPAIEVSSSAASASSSADGSLLTPASTADATSDDMASPSSTASLPTATSDGVTAAKTASASTRQAQSFAQTAPGVYISSSPNPSTVGQTIGLTATVYWNNGVPTTGTVTFKDNGAVLGSSGFTSQGASYSQVVFLTAPLTAGNHSYTAYYSGDASHTAATATAPPQTVAPAPTTTTLKANHNPWVPGQSVTFTAEVDGAFGGVPTGVVYYFNSAGVRVATETLVPGGQGSQATFPVALPAGNYSYYATYQADANFSASSSANNLLNEFIAAPTTPTNLLVSNYSTTTVGQAIVFQALVSDNFYNLNSAGSVMFYKGGVAVTPTAIPLTAVNTGLQTATYITPVAPNTPVGAGVYNYTATFFGNQNFYNSNSNTLTQTVVAPTTTALTSTAGAP